MSQFPVIPLPSLTFNPKSYTLHPEPQAPNPMIPLTSLIFNPPTSRSLLTALVRAYGTQHIRACVYSSNGRLLLALGRAMHSFANELQAGEVAQCRVRCNRALLWAIPGSFAAILRLFCGSFAALLRLFCAPGIGAAASRACLHNNHPATRQRSTLAFSKAAEGLV